MPPRRPSPRPRPLWAVWVLGLCAGCPDLRDPNDRGPSDGSADVRAADPDAPGDASLDAARDASLDAGRDAGRDAGLDAARDAGRDAGPDATDAGPDASDAPLPPGDLGADVASDAGCPAGFADCDGDPSNGCEAPLSTSPVHCGACRRPCAPAQATGGCSGGRCVVTACAAGFADCDGDPANGCEVNTRADPAHCGGCGGACRAPNAVTACTDGACALTACAPGFADCNANLADGCEVDTRSNTAHCGACRRTCAGPNAAVACAEGVCRLAACNVNYGDCDGDPSNGCEVLLTTSVAHCGTCRRACASGQSCSSNQCVCSSSRTFCEGVGCVQTATSVDHCGACNAVCPAVPNGARACVSGRCVPQCNAGYTPLGAACVPCGALGQPACTSGALCAAGLTSCNGTCRSTRTNNAHCGACEAACPSGQSCREGLCCPTGQSNCAGVCRNLNTDDANCGACETACAGQQRCLGGNCAACGASNTPCCARAPECEPGTACMSGTCR